MMQQLAESNDVFSCDFDTNCPSLRPKFKPGCWHGGPCLVLKECISTKVHFTPNVFAQLVSQSNPSADPKTPIAGHFSLVQTKLRCESTLRLLQEELREARTNLPVEVGRLAEAAGEEKSAKPPMRSELPPAWENAQKKKYAEVQQRVTHLKHHIHRF